MYGDRCIVFSELYIFFKCILLPIITMFSNSYLPPVNDLQARRNMHIEWTMNCTFQFWTNDCFDALRKCLVGKAFSSECSYNMPTTQFHDVKISKQLYMMPDPFPVSAFELIALITHLCYIHLSILLHWSRWSRHPRPTAFRVSWGPGAFGSLHCQRGLRGATISAPRN